MFSRTLKKQFNIFIQRYKYEPTSFTNIILIISTQQLYIAIHLYSRNWLT